MSSAWLEWLVGLFNPSGWWGPAPGTHESHLEEQRLGALLVKEQVKPPGQQDEELVHRLQVQYRQRQLWNSQAFVEVYGRTAEVFALPVSCDCCAARGWVWQRVAASNRALEEYSRQMVQQVAEELAAAEARRPAALVVQPTLHLDLPEALQHPPPRLDMCSSCALLVKEAERGELALVVHGEHLRDSFQRRGLQPASARRMAEAAAAAALPAREAQQGQQKQQYGASNGISGGGGQADEPTTPQQQQQQQQEQHAFSKKELGQQVAVAVVAAQAAGPGDAIHKSSHVFIGSALAAIITRVAVSACGGPALASYAASAIMSALLMGAISWWSVRLWRSHCDPADPMHGWLLLLLLPVKVAVSGLALARQWAMGFAVARAFLWILLPAPPLISGTVCLIVACWHCQHWLLEAVAKAAEGASAGSVAAILKPDISPLHLSVIMGFCARFAATCGHLIATDFPHSVSPALHAYFKALHGLVPGAQGSRPANEGQYNALMMAVPLMLLAFFAVVLIWQFCPEQLTALATALWNKVIGG
ncbi:expressed protein isoform A [Micractinium conductrix]|uniref:Expressed protein isoform A n=1 Tax=Micractinium conductrix TaxID=554055 RepID=A0A2P6V592_9CHLO|nr:expressed protein isoform A [Micractinium conductrix]|eukprot:PSC69258.1 expressed protein isoform A [Micractinium conductrix]